MVADDEGRDTAATGEIDDGLGDALPWSAFRLFERRSRATNVVVLAGVLGIWCVTCWALFAFGAVGAVSTATGPDARAIRRLVGAVAGVVSGGILGVLTMRGYGGPMLNPVFAGLASVAGPLVLYPVAYGGLVTVYGPAGRRSLTDLIPTVPSLVAFFLAA